MKIGIIGLGLIGGSLARDLSECGHEITGYDKNQDHQVAAMDLGLIQALLNVEALVEHNEVVIVSIPVKHTGDMIIRLLDAMSASDETTIIDTASTKQSICQKVSLHPRRDRYVACHPLAGTEFSGPTAAITGLYRHKKNIICEEHRSAADSLDTAIALLSSIGLQNIFMDPQQHDKHMAYVSHLSHVSAFALSSAVLKIEQDQKQIFNLASTGFESTVRLAKSSPMTWSSIFADNSTHLLTALDSYIVELQDMREAIAHKDEEAIQEKIIASNEIKRVLSGIKHNVVRLS